MRMKAAVILAALVLGGATAIAQDVQYQIYSLVVGDSRQSIVNGVMFDGTYIWAAVQNPDGGVLEKLTTSGSVVSTTGVGKIPDSMVYDGAKAWVTDYSSGTVSVVSSNGQLLSTIAIPGSPSNPEGMAFDGRYVWVANDSGANSVTKINATSGVVVGTYPVGRAPDALAFDGRYIWVANSNSAQVEILDPATGKMVNGYSTGIFPTNMVYDGANIWVANGLSASLGLGSVTKIRAVDGASEGTFTIPGMQLRGLAYDRKSIWVCNSYSNTVSRLRASNVLLMGTFSTGKSPRAAAFDGSKIWIANSGQNTLTIIVPPESLSNQTAATTKQIALLAGAPTVVTQHVPTSGVSLVGMFHLLLSDE
jgi:DNA-binding beta-propeller fold protein YncE